MDNFDWITIKENLCELDLTKFDNDYGKASLYYFDVLRKIELKTVCTKVEIQNMELSYQKAKKQNYYDIQNIHKIKQDINYPSEEPIIDGFEFQCRVKNCGRSFEQKTSLGHHMMLGHNLPSVDFSKDKVFVVQLRQREDSSRRPAQH